MDEHRTIPLVRQRRVVPVERMAGDAIGEGCEMGGDLDRSRSERRRLLGAADLF